LLRCAATERIVPDWELAVNLKRNWDLLGAYPYCGSATRTDGGRD
jgi:hypothetical protein